MYVLTQSINILLITSSTWKKYIWILHETRYLKLL